MLIQFHTAVSPFPRNTRRTSDLLANVPFLHITMSNHNQLQKLRMKVNTLLIQLLVTQKNFWEVLIPLWYHIKK